MKACKVIFSFLAIIVTLAVSSAQAGYNPNNLRNYIYPKKYASFVVNADSGVVLHQENADAQRYPASLTKLMTIYLTFEALKYGKIKMSDTVVVSRHAAMQPRTNLSLRPGQTINIRNLIESLVVVSANDSAVVLAEHLGKTENNFAQIMTKRAQQLGMKGTRFMNASGLPNPRQITTAKDMAKLMMALKRDFPQYYSMLSIKQFTYKGKCYGAHTNIMQVYRGITAAKTGYVRASGFNLAVGAEKSNKDIVAVVMGGITARTRDSLMVTLLNKGFSKAVAPKKYAYAGQ